MNFGCPVKKDQTKITQYIVTSLFVNILYIKREILHSNVIEIFFKHSFDFILEFTHLNVLINVTYLRGILIF